ncbi:MAG: DUF58 domain-containing protein [Bacteroidales bacterium]|nr:DUF58 domain-containing protein [Bacteroidales bacterium]
MNRKIDINEFYQFDNLELIADQMVEGFITGLHQSPFHGFSVEFAEYRPYNSGESTKNIDWKLYGKTDKLFVKEFEEETNLRCQLIIDCSSSMLFPKRDVVDLKHLNKLYFSIYAAAALIQLLRRQRDAVGLSLFTDRLLLHTPAKSSTVHHKFLFSELEKCMQLFDTKEQNQTDIANNLHEIAERVHKRSLVVIFSDAFDFQDNDNLFLALQHLRHNKHNVIFFHVYDKNLELDFNYQNRPYKFIDMENGNQFKFNARDLKDIYQKSMQTFLNELKIRCGQYRIDWVDVDINEGFHQVVMGYLLKRKKMY